MILTRKDSPITHAPTHTRRSCRRRG